MDTKYFEYMKNISNDACLFQEPANFLTLEEFRKTIK